MWAQRRQQWSKLSTPEVDLNTLHRRDFENVSTLHGHYLITTVSSGDRPPVVGNVALRCQLLKRAIGVPI